MISTNMFNALKVINQRFTGTDAKWVLVGSVSLALQGVPISPSDVDILTDKLGANMIGKLIKEYEVKPVKYNETAVAKGLLGEFRIFNTKIEVMADYNEIKRGEWQDMTVRLDNPKRIDYRGICLPVSNLEEQMESYALSEREKDKKKAELIRNMIEKAGNKI